MSATGCPALPAQQQARAGREGHFPLSPPKAARRSLPPRQGQGRAAPKGSIRAVMARFAMPLRSRAFAGVGAACVALCLASWAPAASAVVRVAHEGTYGHASREYGEGAAADVAFDTPRGRMVVVNKETDYVDCINVTTGERAGRLDVVAALDAKPTAVAVAETHGMIVVAARNSRAEKGVVGVFDAVSFDLLAR